MFYAEYLKLCNYVGKSPSAVAEELGFKKSAVTRWKQGSVPTDGNKQKIADYFGVSVDYLLGNEQKEKPAKKASLDDDDIKFALSGGGGVITDAQFEEVKKFVQFIKERDKNDQK